MTLRAREKYQVNVRCTDIRINISRQVTISLRDRLALSNLAEWRQLAACLLVVCESARDIAWRLGSLRAAEDARPQEVYSTRIARAGLIPKFIGASDPYAVPEHEEAAIDTRDLEENEAIQRILLKLEHEGCLRRGASSASQAWSGQLKG